MLELRTKQSDEKEHFFVFKLHKLPLEILIQSLNSLKNHCKQNRKYKIVQNQLYMKQIKHNGITFSFFLHVFLNLV